MKKIILGAIAVILVAVAVVVNVSRNKHEHSHNQAADACCSGHDHAEHSHDTHAHAHDHAAHNHTHAEPTHAHDHASYDGHDHDHSHDTHAHAHDHAAHDHSHAEHAHAHDHASCDGHDHDHSHDHGNVPAAHDHAEHAHTHEHDHSTCSGHDHAHAHDAHSHDAHAHDHSACDGHDHGTPVKITARTRESIGIELEEVSAAPVLSHQSYYGQMMIPPASVNSSTLTVNGRIHFLVQPGQKVSAGTPLYTLSSPELIELESNVKDAEAVLKRTKDELAALKSRLARIEEIGLKNSELANQMQFKEAEIVSLEIAAERSRNLQRQATAGSIFVNGVITVPAKYDGIIQSLDITEGAWGERGTSALTFVKNSPLEFKATAFGQDDFSQASARLAITLGGKTQHFAGTLRVATQIDEATQSRVIYFVPENLPDTVFPGQIARLDVSRSEAAHEHFVLVPNSAVIKVGTEDVVFVCAKNDPCAFVARKVKTLPSRRGMTPVSDIRVGEIVVSKGGYELKYELPSDGSTPKKTAGHFHADGTFHEGEH